LYICPRPGKTKAERSAALQFFFNLISFAEKFCIVNQCTSLVSLSQKTVEIKLRKLYTKEFIAEEYIFCYWHMLMRTNDAINKRKEALIAVLKDPDEEVRTAAAQALERLEGISCMDEVLSSLRKGDIPTKIKALYALGKIGGEQVLPPLTYCASRPEEELKSVAIEVLGNLANPRAVPALVECLKEKNPAVKAKAVAALGNFSDPALVPLLSAFLEENDGLLDAEAARALGKIGAVSQEQKLTGLLRSPFPRTREAAAFALGMLPVE
jgi:HEAT repeat protein